MRRVITPWSLQFSYAHVYTTPYMKWTLKYFQTVPYNKYINWNCENEADLLCNQHFLIENRNNNIIIIVIIYKLEIINKQQKHIFLFKILLIGCHRLCLPSPRKFWKAGIVPVQDCKQTGRSGLCLRLTCLFSVNDEEK